MAGSIGSLAITACIVSFSEIVSVRSDSYFPLSGPKSFTVIVALFIPSLLLCRVVLRKQDNQDRELTAIMLKSMLAKLNNSIFEKSGLP